jgi:hypothetical protein
MDDDDLINFDHELEDEDFESVFEIDDFNEETIEILIDNVTSSLDTLESVMVNMFYSYHKLKKDSDDRISNLIMMNEESKKYCEEHTILYQQLATNSAKEKEE